MIASVQRLPRILWSIRTNRTSIYTCHYLTLVPLTFIKMSQLVLVCIELDFALKSYS